MSEPIPSRPAGQVRPRVKRGVLTHQERVADVTCGRCGHVVHFSACDAPLTWYQRLRHRRRICGCTHWSPF